MRDPAQRRWALVCALGVAGCVEPRYPGSEVMGTFAFSAGVSLGAPLGEAACTAPGPPEEPFPELPKEPFSFSGTFSRDDPSNPAAAFFSLGGFDQNATFDGQVIRAITSAPRQFAQCECPEVTVEETLVVALLSRSQRDALESPVCPPNALTGGVPAPDGAAITPPQTTSNGFDAVLACGELIDRVLPNPETCACAPCAVRYPVSGDRR
ncbi:MAG: hypothetical protein ACKVPX_15310 [Myxococcaceae bacterium]